MLGSNDLALKPTIKFLCSYGGRILPRYPDGKLRYHGGETRVLSVDRSVTFSELLVKLEDMYGDSVNLRCQFPTEDLDALISITSDEDLANLIEEYDRAAEVPLSSSLKIRAFLSSPKTTKRSASPPSPASSSSNDSISPKSSFPPKCSTSVSGRCNRRVSRPPVYPIISEKAAGKLPHKYAYQHGHGNGSRLYFIPHWQ